MNKWFVLIIGFTVILLIGCEGSDTYLGHAVAYRGVKTSLRPDSEIYTVGGSFPVTLRVHNIVDETQKLLDIRDDNGNYANVRLFQIKDGAQYELPPPYMGNSGIVEIYEVESGEYIETKIDLQYWGFDPEPGEYKIFAEYKTELDVRSKEHEWLGRVMSNKLKLIIE